jgi:stress-induced morphogen
MEMTLPASSGSDIEAAGICPAADANRKDPYMAMDDTEIERLIKQALPDATIEIRDLAGDGEHYAAFVVSAAFQGKTRVQQHQMVYNALKGQMGGALHALALQTATPD